MIKSKSFWVINGSVAILFCLGLMAIWDATIIKHSHQFVVSHIANFLLGIILFISIARNGNNDFFERYRWGCCILGLVLLSLPFIGEQGYPPRFLHFFGTSLYSGPCGLVLCLPLLTYHATQLERASDKIAITFMDKTLEGRPAFSFNSHIWNCFVILFIITITNFIFVKLYDSKMPYLMALISICLLFKNRTRFLMKLGIVAMVILPLLLPMIFSPYRMTRLASFYQYKKNLYEGGFQTFEALRAIKEGGISGLGFFQHSNVHVSPLTTISQGYILQYTALEWGAIGVTLVIGLLMVVCITGIKLLRSIAEPEKQNLALSMLIFILIQAFVGIARALNLAPCMAPFGIPFMSYGLGHEISSYLALSIFWLNFRTPKYEPRKKRLGRQQRNQNCAARCVLSL